MDNLSYFNLSPTRFETETFYRHLRDVVACGEDPFSSWAEEYNLGVPEMAAILKCSPHVYQHHVYSYGRNPHSPLSGQHVLNFCLHARIHPADLTSDDALPHRACPPHVFDALSIIFKSLETKTAYKADRDLAHKAIKNERQRFARFIAESPDIAQRFEDIKQHAMDAAHRHTVQSLTIAHVRNVGDKELRNVLVPAFEQGTRAREFVPSSHVDDFHLQFSLGVQHAEQHLRKLQQRDKQNEGKVLEIARFLYGPVHANAVTRMIRNGLAAQEQATMMRYADRSEAADCLYPVLKMEDVMELLKEEISDTFKLKTRNVERHAEETGKIIKPEEFLTQLCLGAWTLYAQQKETAGVEERVKTAKKDLKDFEQWVHSIETEPERFYVKHLYCNHTTHTDGTQVINAQSRVFRRSLV